MKNMQLELKDFLATHSLSQVAVARALGISSSMLSQFLNQAYKGNVAELEKKLTNYISNYKATKNDDEEIVRTHDLKMISATIDEAISYGEVGAIYGKAGTGKTVAIKHKIKQHPEGLLVEVIPLMTARTLLEQIAVGLGSKYTTYNYNKLFYQLVEKLKRSRRFIVIDEAENLNTACLESVRRLADFTKTPVIYVGTQALIANLKGRGGDLLQLYSRPANIWKMKGLTETDRDKLFGKFGSLIKKYTDEIRRSTTIFRKAKRLATLNKEQLSAHHVEVASNLVILD